jgi:thiamine pyrophosphokinase
MIQLLFKNNMTFSQKIEELDSKNALWKLRHFGCSIKSITCIS